MRTIKRLVLLTVLAFGGIYAYNSWSDGDWPSAPRAASLSSQNAKEQATKLANRAAETATRTADKAGDKLQQSALAAKIKAKMALDDHVNARAIDIDAAGSVITLSGVVASADERQRAVRLASDTEGVTRVVDRLQIRRP